MEQGELAVFKGYNKPCFLMPTPHPNKILHNHCYQFPWVYMQSAQNRDIKIMLQGKILGGVVMWPRWKCQFVVRLNLSAHKRYQKWANKLFIYSYRGVLQYFCSFTTFKTVWLVTWVSKSTIFYYSQLTRQLTRYFFNFLHRYLLTVSVNKKKGFQLT